MKPFLTLVSLIVLTGCGKPALDMEKEKQSIIKCWSDWENKSKAGDPAYYWSDDVVIMGPGRPTIKGKEEFMKVFEMMVSSPGFSMTWDPEPSEIQISADAQMAYLFAKNKVTMTDPTGAVMTGFNQALQVWKKDKNGNWRAAVSVMYPETQNP